MTSDTKSTRSLVEFVRLALLPIAHAEISSLECDLTDSQVYHPGGYMVGIIERLYPELFSSREPKAPARPPQQTDVSYYPKAAEIEELSRGPIDWQSNSDQAKKIRLILERSKNDNNGCNQSR
ncbi:MAG: hypothetical protein ACP5VS_00005 [Desulfomonilaceae bacterium]